MILSTETYLQTINYRSIRFNGINPLNLFRGFALEWLANDSSLLESLLERISEVHSGWVKVYVFKCKSLSFVIIQTIFHSGPIRDVGGALMVKHISRKVKEKYGYETMILHAPSNHTLDPPSKHEVAKITDKIVEVLKDGDGDEGYLCNEPFKIKRGDWEAVVVPLYPAPLIIVSRGKGIDDLPVEINSYAEAEALKLGFKDAIVVEAHNSMVEGEYIVSEHELEELKLLILEALKGCLGGEPLDFKVAFRKASKNMLNHCNDVCSEGISVLSLFTGSKSLCLCSIDGNNMLSSFRSEVVSRCSKIGYSIVEVTTTDSHELTGRLPGGEGYLPVGSSCWNEVLSTILKCSIENMKFKSACSIKYYKVRVDDVKVLGVRGMSVIKDVLERAAVYAVKTFPAIFLFSTLIPVPLTLIL